MNNVKELFVYATSGPFIFLGCVVLVVVLGLAIARIIQAVR